MCFLSSARAAEKAASFPACVDRGVLCAAEVCGVWCVCASIVCASSVCVPVVCHMRPFVMRFLQNSALDFC